jgi:small GTP-binding protein
MNTANRETGQNLLTTKPERVVDYKIVLLGESSVGKSSILERLQNNTFNDNKSSTIGAAFVSKKVLLADGKDLVNLQIWDTAGQERFHNLTPLYYRNSNVALIIFDVSNADSFQKAEYWFNELENYMEEEQAEDENSDVKRMKIILVGNKIDVLGGEQCPFHQGITRFMESHKKDIIKYYETSAKDNIQIAELFEDITKTIPDSLFHSIDEDDSSRKGLIDLKFKNSFTASTSSCQC